MKGLPTLIKLHKTKIDAIITDIKQLETEKSSIELELNLLLSAILQEQTLYYNTEYSFFLENYLSLARKKRDSYSNQLIKLQQQILKLQDDLIFEFGELKKIEILYKNRQRTINEELVKKEEDVINDNVLMKYNYEKKL